MHLLDDTPGYSAEDAVFIAQSLYGVRATALPLPSERDQNFLLHTEADERFILKIANGSEDRAVLEAQSQALAHVSRHTPLCQRLVLTLSGDAIAELRSASEAIHLVRLLTYIPGVTLGKVRWHSPELLRDLGRCLGQMDQALAGFDHRALHRDFHWDIANGPAIINRYKHLISDDELRELVEKLAAVYQQQVAPLLPKLRLSTIHNDANDFNVIVAGNGNPYTQPQRVAGLIDFGDMVYSYTASELAVAIAYAILNKPDPLDVAVHLVRGYHAENALTEDEIAALFGLVCMRLCMSVCHAAHQQQQRPDDDYLAISQDSIRSTLPKLALIHPRLAEATFRHACGLSPIPDSQSVSEWLHANSQTFAPVLDTDLRHTPCIVFDLSISSPILSSDFRENAEPKLTARLFEMMKSAGVKVGIGRYDEPRLLYTSDLFATETGLTDERRTIHLGVDLFAEAGAAVCAPLAGMVHAFADNRAPQDYGPVIILKHETEDGTGFYTLYGHLSRESLEGLYIGKPLAQGERLATIGAADVNGGWTPHLHFQIITDLLELDCDFPGVARASRRGIWRSLSPDPNAILGIPAHRFPPRMPDRSETLAARAHRIGRNLSLAYKEPVKIVRGWMQYLYDEEGRRYLDAYNNVPHVGHCHPRVVKAGCEQMTVLNSNTRYLHDLINCYAERLCGTLPGSLSVCYFVNSGSEANELALRLARAHTGRHDMIVLDSAYHGHTSTLIDISPYKHKGPGGAGAPAWVHTAPLPDLYRTPYSDFHTADNYAKPVFDIIARTQPSGLAGFIAESYPSVGGQIVLPDGYLQTVYAAVREAGGVCIADEVQTGYGRLGSHFWGFEAQGVVPDIVVLGKPIGNGHPIGAVITTPEIAQSFHNGMEFFSTFGGNTVSCAIGLAVLDVVIEENLQAHALQVGKRLLAGLHQLAGQYSVIGHVRGSGLFLGVEMVRDRETLEPAAEEASFIANRLRDVGILLGTDGAFHNVIKIRPPMPFSETDADFLLEMLNKTLADNFQPFELM